MHSLTVNGAPLTATINANGFHAEALIPRNDHHHSEWVPPYGPLVIAMFQDGQAAFAETR